MNILILLVLPVLLVIPSSVFSATELTQNTITWTFDQDYTTGQFANGDYYVVDPGSGVTINIISPNSVTGSRSINGSMISPGPTINQGYDEGMQAATYSDTLNVALDVDAGSPLVLNAGESLVSTRSQVTPDIRPQMSDMAILTCLSFAPATGSFRPPYSGTDKTVKFNISDINYNDLGKLDPLTGAPSFSTYETLLKDVWYEAMSGWVGQFPRAVNNLDGQNPSDIAYGSRMATDSGTALLLLQCDYSDAVKEDLLIYMLQYAIDISGAVTNGTTFLDNGGHGHGRKGILALGAAIFNDSVMIAQLDAEIFAVFGEDNLIQAVESNWYSTDMCNYDGGSCGDPEVQYSLTDHPVGTPEWSHAGSLGALYLKSAFTGGSSGDGRASYRSSYGSDIAGMLSALITDQENNWNRSLSFDYVERFRVLMTEGTVGAWGTYTPGTWVTNMYDTYWDTYRGEAQPTSQPTGFPNMN